MSEDNEEVLINNWIKDLVDKAYQLKSAALAEAIDALNIKHIEDLSEVHRCYCALLRRPTEINDRTIAAELEAQSVNTIGSWISTLIKEFNKRAGTDTDSDENHALTVLIMQKLDHLARAHPGEKNILNKLGRVDVLQ